eukprot:7088855-Pyramimonas_sp.AAC.1
MHTHTDRHTQAHTHTGTHTNTNTQTHAHTHSPPPKEFHPEKAGGRLGNYRRWQHVKEARQRQASIGKSESGNRIGAAGIDLGSN